MVDNPTMGSFNVSITTINGNITLRNSNIIELYFIEDIYSYTMSGKLTFKDDVGLVEFGPLTGNEKIDIEYTYGDIKKSIEFRIFKIQNIKQTTSAGTGALFHIEIIFVHKLFEILNYVKYSYSWSNSTIFQIVTDIALKMLKIINWGLFEPMIETLDCFYMPYWTPFTALNWLTKRSTGSISGEAGYMLFQNTINPILTPSFNIVTLETLLMNSPPLILIGDSGSDMGIYTNEDRGGSYISKILNWNINGIDRWGLKSLAGSKTVGFEMDKKKFFEVENKFSDMASKQTIMGSKMLYPDISEISVDYINTEETEKSNAPITWKNKWHKFYASQNVVNLEVTGHPLRFCGSTIKVMWSSFDKNEPLNLNFSGSYFVKGITHYFNPKSFPAFRQKLSCIKNGYLLSDNYDLKMATKIKA